MLNVIPRFINDMYNAKATQGSLKCSALFIDIAGFTGITEVLMGRGKEGAEDVSELINRIYRPLINSVYSEGGFITGFAGDGFTAIFQDSNTENSTLTAFSAAQQMQHILHQPRRFRKFSDLNLSITARIGISRGSTSWQILGSRQQKVYLFAGDVVVNCANAMNCCKPGEILLDKHALNSISDKNGNAIFTGKINSVTDRLNRVKKSTACKFVPDEVINYPLTGEFRDVASVFVKITSNNIIEELDDFITASLDYAGEYGSYCNGLFIDDKGLHMLMVFGAPVAYEDNMSRAVKFAIALRSEFEKTVSAGITYGTAYAGLVGSQKRGTYTVLGKGVNLAAQLMQYSEPGEILIAGKALYRIANNFTVCENREISFKGKADPVRIYNVVKEQFRPRHQSFEKRMFGRSDELAQLKAKCAKIFQGQFAGITYIYGDAGIGKSRIVSEFQEQFEGRINSIVLQCDSIHRNSFHPFIYGLKNYFHQYEQHSREQNNQYFEDNFRMLIRALKLISDDRKDDILSELIRTKSFSAALLGYFIENSLYSQCEPEIRHTNTIAAIKVIFKAISLIQPLIIIQEDLHWIDEDSQKVYRAVLHNISDYPIAVFALSRYLDDSTRPVIDAPESIPVTVIAMKRISVQAIEKMIIDRLGNSPDRNLLEMITAHTEGNPFYIEQFCMYLLENHLIKLSNQEMTSIDTNIEIPEGIRSIIVARLDRLTRRLRELVQNASILGREFDINVLSLMLQSGFTKDLVIEGESRAIWSALSEMLYIFKHAMLQTVAYDMQLRRRQRELHKLAAESLELLYADDKTRYSEIAYHFEKAENINKVTEYLYKAYSYSNSEYKLIEARELLERLLEYPANEEDTGQYYSDLANVCFSLGDWESAREFYKKSIRFFDAAGSDRMKAFCLAKYAGNAALTPNLDEARKAANEALTYGRNEDNSELLSHALSSLGLVEQSQSKHELAIDIFEQALIHAKATGLSHLITYSLFNLSGCYMMVGRNDKAIEYMKEGLAIAEDINDLSYITEYHSHLGQTYMFLKKYNTARKHLEKALSTARKVGEYYHIARALGSLGSLHFYLGDYSRSHEYLSKEIEICEECTNTLLLTTALYNLAEINIHRADYATAEKQIARALGYARDRNDILYEGVLTHLKARIMYETGDYKTGTELNDNALPLIESMQWRDGIFQSKLLKAKLVSMNDKADAAALLHSMAKEYTESEYTAYINLELFRIHGDEECRRIALKEFTELYENEGQSRTYRKLIEKLKNEVV